MVERGGNRSPRSGETWIWALNLIEMLPCVSHLTSTYLRSLISNTKSMITSGLLFSKVITVLDEQEKRFVSER